MSEPTNPAPSSWLLDALRANAAHGLDQQGATLLGLAKLEERIMLRLAEIERRLDRLQP